MLTELRVMGDAPVATIVDGHLRVSSREGRAIVLVDTGALDNARLTLTAIKSRAERMGALALASPDWNEGVESAVTSQYSPDGKVMIVSRTAGRRQVLSRSWFNVADDIAYQLTLETRMSIGWMRFKTQHLYGQAGHLPSVRATVLPK